MNYNPSYNYKAAVFTIKALTNLHVGSGGENYGIVDNLIQRDEATGFPCINASSLKGALREYFRHYLKQKKTEQSQSTQNNRDQDVVDHEALITHIFGQEKRDEVNETSKVSYEQLKKPPTSNSAGKYRFLQADLLSLPVRSAEKPFFNTTGSWLIENLKHQLALMGHGSSPLQQVDPTLSGHAVKDLSLVELEGTTSKLSYEESIDLPTLGTDFGRDLAIVPMNDLIELVSDFNLPVIARNSLNNGQSINLWYEQILPRETRMFFTILYPENDPYFKHFKTLVQRHPIQIGANASVGYGFCQLSELSLLKEKRK